MSTAHFLAIRDALDSDPSPTGFMEQYSGGVGPNPLNKAIESIDWEDAYRKRLEGFSAILDGEPPSSEVRGLWFGLFEDGDGELDTVDFNVLGFPSFSNNTSWIHIENWAPSPFVVDGGALTQLHRSGRELGLNWNVAAALCEAWGAYLSARCTQAAVETLGHPLGLATGWDCGEVIMHGQYDGRHWDRTGTAAAEPDEQTERTIPPHLAEEFAREDRESHRRIGNPEGVRFGGLFADMKLADDRIVASVGTLPDYREGRLDRDYAFVSPGLQSVLSSASGDLMWRPSTLIDADGNEHAWYVLEMPKRTIADMSGRFMAPIERPSSDVAIDNTWSFSRLVVTREVADRIEAGEFKGFEMARARILKQP